jgi:5-methylcytosine-specific restriction endonuclease McrA
MDRAHNRDRNAKRGPTPVARAARRELKEAGHGRCYVCGGVRPAGELRIDHVVALADGGRDIGSNVAAICHRPCHVEKSRQEAIERAKRRKTN